MGFNEGLEHLLFGKVKKTAFSSSINKINLLQLVTMPFNLKTNLNLPDPIKTDVHSALPLSGNRGGCVSFNFVDQLDQQALDYAKQLNVEAEILYAADLGCSPYFPQAIRFAQLGLMVDAFDIEKPIEEYNSINQELNNKINYIQTDLKKPVKFPHLYSIVYSNRFMSHITYFEARSLLIDLLTQTKNGCRFYLSFGSLNFVKGDYPDRNKPIEERYAKSKILAKNQLTEPVCLYNQSDIYDKLLKDLPVKIIDELEGSTSIKVVFSKTI